jgi:hypothetical protein
MFNIRTCCGNGIALLSHPYGMCPRATFTDVHSVSLATVNRFRFLRDVHEIGRSHRVHGRGDFLQGFDGKVRREETTRTI